MHSCQSGSIRPEARDTRTAGVVGKCRQIDMADEDDKTGGSLKASGKLALRHRQWRLACTLASRGTLHQHTQMSRDISA